QMAKPEGLRRGQFVHGVLPSIRGHQCDQWRSTAVDVVAGAFTNSRYENQDTGGNAIDSSLNEGGLGDVTANMYYRLFREGETRPDVVWNFGVTAPTGKDPYGISTRIVDTDNSGDNLTVPNELPTGDGVWSVSTGLSFLKTVDPAIIFANIGYTHNIEESFDNISSGQQTVSGDVDLGDSVRFGFGTAFALNERFSLSMSLSYQHAFETEISTEGGPKRTVVGSSANAASVNFGATYGLTDSTSIVTSVGVGLTDDAPDFTLNFRMPFQI
ncbi:transporter, partial [Halomonas faecis]|uniref:transporter n=1 Tax=Halomonas faecis TaxID=1562110 RepID=UPI0013D20762